MHETTVYDLIVVGSGPGGATVAHQAARAGLQVLMLERHRLPRYKTCGGGLTRRTLRLLPNAVRDVCEREYRTFDFNFVKSNLCFRIARDETFVSMTMRDRLDHLLVRHACAAGATLLEACTVRDVVREADAVSLHTSLGRMRGRFVVAADGATSTVAKKAGWQDSRHLAPAVEHELYVDETTYARYAQAPRIDYQVMEQGYGWVFPKGRHLSVGIGALQSGGKHLNRAMQGYLGRLGLERPQRADKHGFFVPLRPRQGPPSRDRIMLVGDAAGFADPLSAEGIYAAVHSAHLAVQALLAGALVPAHVDAHYAQGVQAEVLPELAMGRLFSRAFYGHAGLRNLLVWARGRRLCELAVDACSGDRTYQDLADRHRTLVGWLRAMTGHGR